MVLVLAHGRKTPIHLNFAQEVMDDECALNRLIRST